MIPPRKQFIRNSKALKLQLRNVYIRKCNCWCCSAVVCVVSKSGWIIDISKIVIQKSSESEDSVMCSIKYKLFVCVVITTNTETLSDTEL